MQKLSPRQADLIVNASLKDPFSLLGAHHHKDRKGKNSIVIRAFIPDIKKLSLCLKGKTKTTEQPMQCIHPAGLYETEVKRKTIPLYHFRAEARDGHTWEFNDPYRFLPVLGELDLHLFNEGNHFHLYEKLGSHVITHQGVKGVHFALWAPNAERVSLVGDFNFWDGRRHPMRLLGNSGIWEIFIPDLEEGTLYKYEIKTASKITLKSDPFAFTAQLRPETASKVYDLHRYKWDDNHWLIEREKKEHLAQPMNIYEVHLGSWAKKEEGGFIPYKEMAHLLLDYVLKMHYTHIELLPVMEHPLDASWGYQVTGYYGVTSRFGTPDDFRYFVDLFHHHNIGVLIDWVPAHFPKDEHGLAHFDGTALYEHADPRQGEHTDWGTKIFNFGRHEVTNFLISNALFWAEHYHIDGFRVDAVASMLYLDYSRKEGEWVPNAHGGNENLEAIAFLKKFNEVIHGRYPGILTIAEESTAWPAVTQPVYLGGLGFDMKWNMGWMNDILSFFEKDPIYRKYHFNNLTFSLLYAFSEHFTLVLSHDEVVHGKGSLIGKMPGNEWEKCANLRLLLGFMFAHPGKKLLFMGGEFAQWNEWNEQVSLDWHLLSHEPHGKMQRFCADMGKLYQSEPAFWERDSDPEGFQWIDFHDAESSVISFLRRGNKPENDLIFIFNFTPTLRKKYRVGFFENRPYREIFNSDSSLYWGSNNGNGGGITIEAHPWQECPFSALLTLPPLGFLIIQPC